MLDPITQYSQFIPNRFNRRTEERVLHRAAYFLAIDNAAKQGRRLYNRFSQNSSNTRSNPKHTMPIRRRSRSGTPFGRVVKKARSKSIKRGKISKSFPRKTVVHKGTQMGRNAGRRNKVVRLNSTGFVGSWARGTSRLAPTYYSKTGSVVTYDTGATLSDPKCLWLGHTTNIWRQMHAGVFRCIVRALLLKCGIAFTDWQEDSFLFSNNATFSVHYYQSKSSGAAREADTYTAILGETYDDVAVALMLAFYTSVSGKSYSDIVMDLIELKMDNNESRIYATQFVLDIDIGSTLSIQNRSPAGVDVVDDDLAGNITNNPIEGKSYEGKGNHFLPFQRNELLSGTYSGFVADSQLGLINQTPSGSMTSALMKPQPGSFFKSAKKTARLYLAPGQIKRSVLRTKRHHTLQGFYDSWSKEIRIYGPNIYSIVLRETHPFGDSRLFALSKTLDAGDEAAYAITVGYEMNYTVSVGCGEKGLQQTAVVHNLL